MIVDESNGFYVLNGDLLKRKRLEKTGKEGKPLSQTELASRFEPPVHPATVCQWEKGKSTPPLERFKELCLILNVRADELLGLIEVPHVVEEVFEEGDLEDVVVKETHHTP